MARWGRIARRDFLIGTAAVAGGFAVGYVHMRRPHPNPLGAGAASGGAALTPYVLIDGAGVTLITPRAEMGQGATSVQAALIAEELDVAWDDIRTDPGPPAPAYYNRYVVAQGMAAATDASWQADATRAFGRTLSKVMGLQITGGSSSVPDAYDRLRRAGATARAMLVGAAAARLGVPAERLSTEDGAVIAPDGTRLAYTELAGEAAEIDPPRDVALKDPSDWRYLGKPMRRLDIVAKSTGTERYGIDQTAPGMLYAAVRTNPRRGGGVRGFDARAAEAMRGVVKVVPVTGGAGVLADNTWRAFEAVRAISFDWGPAPYPPDSAGLFEAIAGAFAEDARDSRLKDASDVEATLAGGADVAAEYRVPFLAHAPLEPMSAFVWLRDGEMEIRAGTQIPRFAVKTAARVSGLPEDAITLNALPIGGSFGRRLEDDFLAQAVELAMAAEGRPVKLTWSREEDMTHDFPRPAAIARGRGRVEGGRVTAFDLSIACPSVAASQMGRLGLGVPGPDLSIVDGAWDQPFAIPAYRVTGYRAPETVPVSSWRSVGASGNGFFHECLLDELIRAAGADPLDERLRLCTHAPSARVLEAVGEMAGWGSDTGPGRGRGLAFTLSFGVPCAEVVEVTATGRGIRIDRVFAAAEVGRVLDPVNIENQMQGGVVWGLGHAIGAELTYADGRPAQENFDSYAAMRIDRCPEITVRALETGEAIRGIGEPTVPPAAPALANAIFAATGRRVREMPLNRSVDFA
ncbi:isoquinoline 1-oxidoreductase, beta subunit [Rhodovulum sp. ES.010]|uniref:xanthine dehydrogenase family protein molybdopterin-binding subunit n=1 Tax=Rhodovulum sp. ES.010 TaxID=1882821 RepID=UPI00092C65EC|nr:molybdopterin cofactor-binding domain-containing protein [Rhodovulum sp. ES.010]SIO56105.1 isoquinoline 1-oxidoreductase, beta subunit [Rhodovulum sp. ES.010]